MRKFVITALLALSFVPLNAGKIVTDSLWSRVLGVSVKFNVYLPDGYGTAGTAGAAGTGRAGATGAAAAAEKTYPAVYLLHGLTDDYTAWRERGLMRTVADELIVSGEAVPMVIIMPNAGGPDVHKIWNGYFNMPGWNYEDFFFGELVPQVESKYSCGGSKGRRAVMGLSMGGGGSVVYCQRHPDMFSSCYAMSPWLDNRTDEVGSGQDSQDKLYLVCKAVREHSALDFMDSASDATLEQLRTVAWFTDCGDDDYLLRLSVDFHFKMKKAHVHHELRVRNGLHNWEYWHYGLRLALPFASRNFSL